MLLFKLLPFEIQFKYLMDLSVYIRCNTTSGIPTKWFVKIKYHIWKILSVIILILTSPPHKMSKISLTQ